MCFYTITYSSHLSFGSAARSHPSSVQPAAASSLPNHHCTVASTDGLTYTHTILKNQQWWCTTNHLECVLSLCLPFPTSISLPSSLFLPSSFHPVLFSLLLLPLSPSLCLCGPIFTWISPQSLIFLLFRG